MTFNSWYTKKDVLKDLHQATGKYVPDLDEVLVGEQPPPQQHKMFDKDEEDLHLLRLYGGSEPEGDESRADNISKPDLAGITKMLRMVAEEDQEIIPTNLLDKQTSSTDHLIISKLNPNVEEFVPSKQLTLKTVTNTDANCHKESFYLIKEGVKKYGFLEDTTREMQKSSTVTETQKATTCDKDNFTIIEDKVDKNSLTEDETKKMKQKLKSTIIETQNATCGKLKRTRNLAMATLLKLHCEPQTEIAQPQPKLMTPAYFQRCKADYPAENNSTKICLKVQNSVEDVQIIEKEKTDVNLSSNESNIDIAVNKVQKWLDSSDNNKPKNYVKEADVGENIVTSPVNGKKETNDKPKSLYLGAITFKRKACSKAASPASSDSNECIKTCKVERPVFKPSELAAELTKKYMARSEAIEANNQTIWTKLEKDLKAKDEEILKKQESGDIDEQMKTDELSENSL